VVKTLNIAGAMLHIGMPSHHIKLHTRSTKRSIRFIPMHRSHSPSAQLSEPHSISQGVGTKLECTVEVVSGVKEGTSGATEAYQCLALPVDLCWARCEKYHRVMCRCGAGSGEVEWWGRRSGSEGMT
jgi:hypothetical protein